MIIEIFHAECQRHARHRPEEINGDRIRGRLAVVENHVLKQQRRPAAWQLAGAIGDLAEFQLRVHRVRNPNQLTDTVDGSDEFLQ